MHTQDICRPLGIPQSVDGDRARRILDFLVSRKARVIKAWVLTDPRWVTGLRLAPDDLDWVWGEGAEVRGTAEAVMMVLGGGPQYSMNSPALVSPNSGRGCCPTETVTQPCVRWASPFLGRDGGIAHNFPRIHNSPRPLERSIRARGTLVIGSGAFTRGGHDK